MKYIEDVGGPAFRAEFMARHPVKESGLSVPANSPGMSLRAYFAAKNVAAMVSTIRSDDDYARARDTAQNLGHKTVSEWFASDAVKQADALIAALER